MEISNTQQTQTSTTFNTLQNPDTNELKIRARKNVLVFSIVLILIFLHFLGAVVFATIMGLGGPGEISLGFKSFLITLVILPFLLLVPVVQVIVLYFKKEYAHAIERVHTYTKIIGIILLTIMVLPNVFWMLSVLLD